MNGVNLAGSPAAISLQIHCVEVFLQVGKPLTNQNSPIKIYGSKAYLALAPFMAIFLPPLSTPVPCFDFGFAVVGIPLLMTLLTTCWPWLLDRPRSWGMPHG